MFPLLVDNLKSEDYFYAQKRNMKKKTVLKLLFITSCLVAVCSLFYNNETSTLDSLAFQNVESWNKYFRFFSFLYIFPLCY